MTWRKYFILVSVQTSDHEQLDLNLKKLQTKFCCVDTVWGFVFVVAVNWAAIYKYHTCIATSIEISVKIKKNFKILVKIYT